MQQGIHLEESFAPVAGIDSIRFLLCMSAAQGKHAFVLGMRNEFQNIIQFDAANHTYNIPPPLFSEYIHLQWPDHPDLAAISTYPQLYTIQNFRSMQGEKYAGRKWY
jgi:hypothetical protein